MKKKLKTHSKELKMLAVKMYLEDEIGSTTIAKELDISHYSLVLRWVERYKELGESGLEERRGRHKVESPKRVRKKKELSLEEENERLRAEVEYLKKLMLIGRA